jgi:SAM-dependent methyltransferase
VCSSDLAVQSDKEHAGKFYGSSLLGSALGCLASIVLMNLTGAVNALVLVSALVVLSGAATALPALKRTQVFCIVLGLLLSVSLFFSDSLFPMRSPLAKPESKVADGDRVMTDWTSLARVDVHREKNWPSEDFGLWGLSPAGKFRLPERLGMLIDYWAYSAVLKHSDEPGYYDFLDNLPMTAVYRVAAPAPSTLIIGAGGGMDIRAALRAGASHVDAVEVNPSICRIMTKDLADYSGGLYLNPKVDVFPAEGRNFLESSSNTYDIVQMSAVDTSCASQAGAFSLTENNLYTLEGFRSCLDRLKPEGLLEFSSWYLPSATGYPRYSLRLFCLAWSALAARGIEKPENHLFFFESRRFAVLLVKKNPFQARDIATLSNLCIEKQYACLFRPDRVVFSSMPFYSFVKSRDKDTWIDEYPFNVAPPTDNSPFYFESRKFRTILSPGDFIKGYSPFDGQTILVYLLIGLAFAALFFTVAAVRMDRRACDIPGWFYFFLTGMGFALAETTYSQQLTLFLGHPVYALSVAFFSIFLFSGIGSWISNRLADRIPVPFMLLGISALMAVQAVIGVPLINKLTGTPHAFFRASAAAAFLAPSSFLMGTAFPEGVRKIMENGKTAFLGTHFAFNGLASVVGASLAVFTAIASGFSTALLASCACYGLAGLVFPWISRE